VVELWSAPPFISTSAITGALPEPEGTRAIATGRGAHPLAAWRLAADELELDAEEGEVGQPAAKGEW
jgi:hypothetical protein